MYCTTCGEWNENSALTCIYCGAAMREYEDPSAGTVRAPQQHSGTPAQAMAPNLGQSQNRDGLTMPAQSIDSASQQNVRTGNTNAPNPGSTPNSTPKARGENNKKRMLAIVFGVLAAAIVAFALIWIKTPGPDAKAPGPDAPEESKPNPDLAEVVPHIGFDLGELASDSQDEAVAILDDLVEFEEGGSYYYVADSETEYFYRDIYWNNSSSSNLEEEISYLDEHAADLPWYISLAGYYLPESNDDVTTDLASLKDGTVTVDAWRFNGYVKCSDPSSEDVAAFVAEEFNYEGIALYQVQDLSGLDTYQGYAVAPSVAASISANPSFDTGYWLLTIEVSNVRESGQEWQENYLHLCNDPFLSSEYGEVFIDSTDNSSEGSSQAIVSQHDESEFNAAARGYSTSIGDHFEVPFDLADLVTKSPSEVADLLKDLPSEVTTFDSDGDTLTSAQYTGSVEMGDCYGIDTHEDGSIALWDYETMKLDSAPWVISLTNDDHYNLTVEDMKSGEKPSEATLYGYYPADKPTCEEIANLVSEVYAFDQIVIYREKNSSDSAFEIDGYARADGTALRIYGWPRARSIAGAPYVGTYEISLSVEQDDADVDGGSANGAFFEDKYNDDTLESQSSDYYRE